MRRTFLTLSVGIVVGLLLGLIACATQDDWFNPDRPYFPPEMGKVDNQFVLARVGGGAFQQNGARLAVYLMKKPAGRTCQHADLDRAAPGWSELLRSLGFGPGSCVLETAEPGRKTVTITDGNSLAVLHTF